ncbi:MAG: hypothetical protein D6714_16760 [Bacteroidetes bacterium]|nr:MAG: hypothetical protein D6714_16760 [Bacteroidota bacterium]
MRFLKNLLFLFLLLTVSGLFAQDNIPQYTVRIGTFINPKPAEFEAIRSLGFIYTERQPDGYTGVLIGGYTSKNAAEDMARKLQSKGFLNPSVSLLPVKEGEPVTMIQLGVKKATEKFKWEKYLKMEQLYVVINNDQVKILTGIYPDIATAKAQLPAIRAMGFSDAFVKKVNSALLHEVTPFETWGEKRPLIPLVFREDSKRETHATPAASEIPEPFEKPQDRIKTQPEKETPPDLVPKGITTTAKPAAFERSFAPPRPTIRVKEKRNSVIELQKALKKQGTYSGSLDGYYGKGTAAAFEKAYSNHRQVRKYKILARFGRNMDASENSGQLADAIKSLWTSPETATQTLRMDNSPLAKAYRAYYMFQTLGPQDEVDNLMNAAIKEAFKDVKPTNMPRFDYTLDYKYTNLSQLLSHLRYIHEVSDPKTAVPCWMFQKHAYTAIEAFNLSGGSNIEIENCGGFWTWEEVATLYEIAKDLDTRASFDSKELNKSQARLNKMFLAPDPVSAEDLKALNQWQEKLWVGIDGWAFRDPLLEEIAEALRLSFFQTYVLLEDYFMDEGYKKDEAKGMALETLHALTAYHLARFTN